MLLKIYRIETKNEMAKSLQGFALFPELDWRWQMVTITISIIINTKDMMSNVRGESVREWPYQLKWLTKQLTGAAS